jgi:transcriptional regulator with XRE-family HTH domain
MATIKELQEKILQGMKRRNMSVAEYATLLDVSPAELSRILKGTRMPTDERIVNKINHFAKSND